MLFSPPTLNHVLPILALTTPIVRVLIKKDDPKNPLIKRHYLAVCLIISFSLVILPFANKQESFYDKLRVSTDADDSTIFQQWKRLDMHRASLIEKGTLSVEEGEAMKKTYAMYKDVLFNSSSRYLYAKFGDLMEYSPGGGKASYVEEPSFLFVVAHAGAYYVWVAAIVCGICYYLPGGGLLTICMALICMFALDVETRYMGMASIYDYFFFLNKIDWVPFEIINAMKVSIVGIVNLIIVIAGVFVRNHMVSKTIRIVRSILKSNAAIITALKNGPSQTFSQIDDEEEINDDFDIGSVINRLIAILSLGSFIFLRNSGE